MTHPKNNIGGIVFGLSLAFFAAYQQFKLPVVLPVLLADYGYDRTLAGGFMSVYALAGLFLSMWLGGAIERYGAGRLILTAQGMFVVATSVTVLAPTSGVVVLVARGLEGIAFAVLAICGPVLANANASPRQLPVVVGLTATWIPVGQLAATALAPVALATVGWQLLWVVAIAGAIGFALWTLALQTSGKLLTPSKPAPTGRNKPIGKQAIPASQRAALGLTAAVFTLWSGQYFAYMTWLPQYLVEVHDLGVSAALLGYVVPVSLVMTFCVVTGMLLRAGIQVGFLMVAGLVMQAPVWWLLPYTGGGWSGVLSLVVYGIGAGVVPTCLFAMPSVILGHGRNTAGAFGIVMTGRNLGVLMGPVLLAQAFKLTGTWDLAAPIFGVITTLCLLLGIVLAVKLRRR